MSYDEMRLQALVMAVNTPGADPDPAKVVEAAEVYFAFLINKPSAKTSVTEKAV